MKHFKMQISTQTDKYSYRKNVTTNEEYILRKMAQNLNSLTLTIFKK